MTTEQFWVVAEGDDWCVRAVQPLSRHGWETVKRTRSRDLAIAWAADRNARAMGLEAPQRRSETLGQAMARLQRETGAEPIVDARGRRYAVHHRNQHTD